MQAPVLQINLDVYMQVEPTNFRRHMTIKMEAWAASIRCNSDLLELFPKFQAQSDWMKPFLKRCGHSHNFARLRCPPPHIDACVCSPGPDSHWLLWHDCCVCLCAVCIGLRALASTMHLFWIAVGTLCSSAIASPRTRIWHGKNGGVCADEKYPTWVGAQP